MKPIIDLALFGVLVALAGTASAAIQCSIPAGVSLNFGVYDDSLPANKNVSSAFAINCCRTSPPNPTVGTMTITMGISANSGQINTRQMKNSANADLMSYQLSINSFGGPVWGDGVIGGSIFTQGVSISRTCPAGGQAVAVGSAIFGTIFAQQPVSAGNYSDSLTITIAP